MKHNKSEQGQVLIFIVLGLVLILGFAGLAIDGGRIYSDRRNGQNGADAASLAGAGAAAMRMEDQGFVVEDWDCSNSAFLYQVRLEAIQVAIARAASNGFTLDDDYEADWNGVETRCYGEAFNNGMMAEHYIDVITRITTETEPIFVKMFYPDTIESQVEAVARVWPRQPFGYGSAIVALNPAECSGNTNGVVLGGAHDIKIVGGGIFSNGCLAGDGAKYGAIIQDGGVAYVGEQDGFMNFFSDDDKTHPIPVQHVDTPLPVDYYPQFNLDCNLPAVTLRRIDHSMNLDPGLYCITGEDSTYAIKLAAMDFLTGDGVTIYVKSGSIDITGGAVLDLKAPGPEPVNNAISGLLFYIETEGITVNLEGTPSSTIAGLIYAPYANVTLTGKAEAGTAVNFTTQVIAKNVNLRGDSELNIVFNPALTWHLPTKLELAK
ncbi:MAG: Tad domain-containing protein [Anaerolineales bacterium]|jgi:hypothetical protein|nr:Tad domain-containing protein [Anaerolineales bacterium]